MPAAADAESRRAASCIAASSAAGGTAASGNPSFNFFGIKATGGWRGAAVASPTLEYEGGVAQALKGVPGEWRLWLARSD